MIVIPKINEKSDKSKKIKPAAAHIRDLSGTE